jgi:hypothetical protein
MSCEAAAVEPDRSSESRDVEVIGCFAAINGLIAVLDGTGEQKLYETFIAQFLLSFQKVFSAINPFDLKFLA